MNNLILLTLILVSNSIFGQVYTIDWAANDQQKVKITLNDSSRSLLIVRKEYGDTYAGKVLDKYSLTLVGDFEKCENSTEYNLDYVKYNYFLVSFTPTVTSLYLDKLLDPSVSQGKLGFGFEATGNANSRGLGDITYWCDCGGDSNSGRGECVSSLNSGVIKCVSTGCTECIGTVIEHSRIISGGILIQTLKETIGYDDQTRL